MDKLTVEFVSRYSQIDFSDVIAGKTAKVKSEGQPLFKLHSKGTRSDTVKLKPFKSVYKERYGADQTRYSCQPMRDYNSRIFKDYVANMIFKSALSIAAIMCKCICTRRIS